MKLASVEIRNFRAIEEMKLPLHPQLTVLHGANALGKTSVLRAIAVGWGAIPTRIRGVTGTSFAKNDQRIGSDWTQVTLETQDGGSWSRQRGISLYAPVAVPNRWLTEQLVKLVQAARAGDPMQLPLAVYYDTERTVLDIPKRRRGFPKEFPRSQALQGALSARTNFRRLFQWFHAKENEELRDQREHRDFDFRLPGLSAVRNAIRGVVRDASEPRIRTRPLRFEVTLAADHGTERLQLDHLSGGYRAVLALASDLAWRMAQGNPHLEDPLESEAVVLIDEVELHLHPEWQQRILGELTRTFPNAQFIVTTHSPQVLTTVKPEQVVTLEREDGRIVARGPGWGTYGAEAGDVLQAVMGVARRPDNEFSRTLAEYRRLVSKGDGEASEARRLRTRLNEMAPDDPALASADLEIRQRKLFRNVAESS